MAFVCRRTVRMAAIYQLKIKYDQDKLGVFSLDAKRPVNVALEDKRAVNEHHVARKSHDTTQKKNVLTWFISKYHVIGLKQTCGIKNVTLKAAKKNSSVSRSTGKSNNLITRKNEKIATYTAPVLKGMLPGTVTKSSPVTRIVFSGPSWTSSHLQLDGHPKKQETLVEFLSKFYLKYP